MKPKTWRAGVADEPWKVEVCRRDDQEAKKVLSFAEYVLGDRLEKFTGEEIANALRAYSASAVKSIENGETA